jgi:(E)-4-hydroxy-3-methylbut-2-enyl-diphosphate synthase
MLQRYGAVCAEAMVESALENVKLLEDMDFREIKISLKASSVRLTLEAYRLMAARVDYPLHIGITEAGTKDRALIKSALGLGISCMKHWDTIRYPLPGTRGEVLAAYEFCASGLEPARVGLIPVLLAGV